MRPLSELNLEQFETLPIFKQLSMSSRALAELKGVAAAIPNQRILIDTLSLQEAKDSSAIENIVTTHDELFRVDLFSGDSSSPAAKEVHRYGQALGTGFERVKRQGLITTKLLLEVQQTITGSAEGVRKLPGTVLANSLGETVYTPPQVHSDILSLLLDLESFLNDGERSKLDPLIKMAIAHHQFESIHPFYDGNGRTGRILNVLYLVKERLLDIPVLYLSRPLVRRKDEYYRLLQAVRISDVWEEWTLFMLRAIQDAATDGCQTIERIREALQTTKHRIRERHKFYSQDLINHLFYHPYTKIEILAQALDVTRLTATKYLEALVEDGILEKLKLGRSNYYINAALWEILTVERELPSQNR